MNYEKRLINFLRANPNIRMTPEQVAGVWKRSKTDVKRAAVSLFNRCKLTYTMNGEMRLREGIGYA